MAGRVRHIVEKVVSGHLMNLSAFPVTCLSSTSTLLSRVRCLIVVVMYRLIRASSRCLIQIIAQVNVKLLPSAYVPSRSIRSCNTRNSPRQTITVPRELAVSVLRS